MQTQYKLACLVKGLGFVSCLFSISLNAETELNTGAHLSLDGKVKKQAEDKGKWLPVPIPVSNPTLGSGLQAVLLYLHPQLADAGEASPSATSGIGGMYTDSESAVIGVFHDNYFAGDKYRLKLIGGLGDLNLDYYGIGDASSDTSVSYNIRPGIAFGQFSVRLPRSESSYLGVSHLYADASVQFRVEIDPDPENRVLLPAAAFDSVTSSLGLVYTFDNRNNSYYPSRGANITLTFTSDSGRWGSDYEFEKLMLNYRRYVLLAPKHVLAFKVAVSDVGGDPPFYLLSTLQMRGFAAGRYMDNTSFSGHAEWRYKFLERWGVNVFLESGRIGDSLAQLKKSNSVDSVGFGFRWQPIASKKLNLGVDYAQSSDDSALYLRVGEAF